MKKRVIELIRELRGRSHADYVEILMGQLHACLDGAVTSYRLSRGEIGPTEAREKMLEIEHVGDEWRSALVKQLRRSIVTPIDREDLFRASRSIDDVLDNLRDYVREVDLLSVGGETHQLIELTKAVVETIELLLIAVTRLVNAHDDAGNSLLVAKKSTGAVRRIYQRAIADLLGEDSSQVDKSFLPIMKKRELLRRLDIVGLRLGEATDALADGIIKRSY